MFHKLVFRKRPRKKVYLKTYLSNTSNTVDQIQIQIHGLKFDQIQIRRICICKYKYVFDPSPADHLWSPVTFILSKIHISKISFKFPRGQRVNIYNIVHYNVIPHDNNKSIHILGPFHELFFHYNSNSMKIWFWYHPSYSEMITMKFCIWHDSCAVMACAKLLNDMIPTKELLK